MYRRTHKILLYMNQEGGTRKLHVKISRKKRLRAFVISVCLTLTLAIISLGVISCGNTQTESYSYAPRLDTLDGKTIGLLSNDEWQAFRILPEIQRQLQELYPSATFVTHTELPIGLVNVGKSETAQTIAQKGCQAVIIANIG